MRLKLLLSVLLLSVSSGVIANTQADTPADDAKEDLLPDLLNCEAMEWMKSCSEINNNAKKNPGAPLRVHGKDGLEFNFPPGTPTVMMHYLLDPTPAHARAVIKYNDAMQARQQLAAKIGRQELVKMKGGFGFSGYENNDLITYEDQKQKKEFKNRSEARSHKTSLKINPSKARVFVFYSSTCGVCHQNLPDWMKLVGGNPRLDVRFLQINDDPAYVAMLNNKYKLKAKALTGPQKAKLADKVRGTPTIFIESKTTGVTSILVGKKSVHEIEYAIAEATE